MYFAGCIRSTFSYILASTIIFFNIELNWGEVNVSSNLIMAGIVGGTGVSLSFLLFKQKLTFFENVILVLISTFASFSYLLMFEIKITTHLPLFVIWQGAVMGCLAYFISKKQQKENKLLKNQVNSAIT